MTNQHGFSLMEVVLAALIFVMTVAGMFATLSYVRQPVGNRELELTAAVFGKQVLEGLRYKVSNAAAADYYACSSSVNPCPDFALSVGAHAVPVANLPPGVSWPGSLTALNGGILNYTVTCADNSAAPCTSPDVGRKVVLSILR